MSGHVSPLEARGMTGRLCTGDVTCSVVQSLSRVRVFATPWTTARQPSLSFTGSQSWLKFMSIESVIPSNHLILFRPLLLPSVFPSIRVFSSESAVCVRWPQFLCTRVWVCARTHTHTHTHTHVLRVCWGGSGQGRGGRGCSRLKTWPSVLTVTPRASDSGAGFPFCPLSSGQFGFLGVKFQLHHTASESGPEAGPPPASSAEERVLPRFER